MTDKLIANNIEGWLSHYIYVTGFWKNDPNRTLLEVSR